MSKPRLTQYGIEFPSDGAVRSKLTRTLLAVDIDFQSMITCEADGRTTIRFLAPRNDALSQRLRGMGLEVREKEVFRPETPHSRRTARARKQALAAQDVNVLSLYGVVEGDNMRIVLAMERPSDAAVLIERLGYASD